MNTDKQELFERFIQILTTDTEVDCSHCELNDVSFHHVGIDSLSHYRLIVGIEEQFKIKIKDEEMARATDFSSLVRLVQQKLSDNVTAD